MGIPLYRVYFILKVSTDHFKHTTLDIKKNMIAASIEYGDIALSLDAKNKQLANQLIDESIARFTMEYNQEDIKVTDDVSDELLAEDRRRRLYGTSC
jgi:hypothetical protein